MLNSRLVYILMANIAVLGANVWLFMDPKENKPESEVIASSESQAEDEEQTHDKSLSESEDITNESNSSTDALNNENAKDKLSEEQQNQLQIALLNEQLQAQKEASQKEKQSQQAELARLKAENQRLIDQVSTLDNQVHIQESYLTASQQREKQLADSLDKERSRKADLENPPISRIKGSIEQKPDLLKNKTPITTTPEEQHVFQAEVVEDNENGNHIETDTVDSKEEQIADIERFSGAVEFGFNYDQDNQVTKGLLGRLILDYDEVDKFNVNSDLQFEFESEDKEMTTDKFRWQLQGDYNLNPTNVVFARSDVQRSKFSSYEREDTYSTGYGHIFFDTRTHKFNMEVGPGYKFALPNAGEDAVSVNEFIVRTRLNYERVVSDSLQVALEGVFESGHANSVYSAEFRAQNRIYKQLYLIFDATYKYNQNVPVDTVHQEVSTGFNIMYAF
ncbi:DUF481 domain-containing protein [Psychromonas sp. RZ22]|uniref:DUF481 domain-containing protein n=1 Tax=Psychromonas algarum TaxID=2555643 RepID=UPI00106760A3|nr:DUF481 domain-containing protein [Psychromonas sp. RZ22]TEW55681.1 DUF481 domain-containing protein [Psychromonas sp. RZ22]